MINLEYIVGADEIRDLRKFDTKLAELVENHRTGWYSIRAHIRAKLEK